LQLLEDFQRTLVRRANEQKERFDAYKAIDNRLRTIESGDSFGWWELNLAFLADERGQLVEEFSSDLTATKVWSALELPAQERVLSTAVKYLTDTGLQAPRWLGTPTFHRPAAAAYRAFRLLLKLDKQKFTQLPASVWKAWGPSIFVSFNSDDAETRRLIVQRAYELAPDTICRGVARIMLKDQTEYAAREITRLLDCCFDEPLAELFWKLLNRTKADKVAEAFTFYLARKNYFRVSQLLIQRMSALLNETPVARDWVNIATRRHSSGIFGSLVPAVIWSDARGGDGELLVPGDPSELAAAINGSPHMLLHNHDPGKPIGQVLEAANFETEGGEKFVAAILGYYAGGEVLSFRGLSLDTKVLVASPTTLPNLPDGNWIQLATDPREVDVAWMEEVTSDAPLPIRRTELSHNAADSIHELIGVGIVYLAIVWNPFVTALASEAGKATYAEIHAWFRKLLEKLAKRRNPTLVSIGIGMGPPIGIQRGPL
jgi:hypothetical protein